MNNNKQQQESNRQFLMRYASLGTQLLVAIGLGVFLGLQGDKWLHTSPVLACVLPLLILIAIFYKLFRETSRKKNNE
jgi:F0F1-type ATP synthase assembly protein I